MQLVSVYYVPGLQSIQIDGFEAEVWSRTAGMGLDPGYLD